MSQTLDFSGAQADSAWTASEGAPSGREGLLLRNGCAAPLDMIPCFSFSYFSHWLTSRIRGGDRVAAFFLLPRTLQEMTMKDRAPVEGKLVAIIANEGDNKLAVACCEVEKSYPSLTPRLPQLHLFERELYEKYGLVPEGHPWLKPVRFSLIGGPEVGNMDFFRVDGDEVHEVAVGPIHAGVIECGHFRFQCLGELVMHLEISLGYHHRGVEALLRNGPGKNTLPLMETLSGDSTIAHAWAYCSALEALADWAPSPRGQLIRSLALELERLANHTGDMGALAGDVGFLSTLSYCGRLRGDWLNMSALICGSRFGRGLLIPGGVRHDLDPGLVATLKQRIAQTDRDVQGALQLLWHSPSVMARLTGIGTIPKATAWQLGMVGPAARASGLARDARQSHPLAGLPSAPDTILSSQGDVRARTFMRHAEINASISYCKRLLEDFLGVEDEAGVCILPGDSTPLMPEAFAVSLVEGWRGEVCHVAVTGKDRRFCAYVVTDPSFHNWMGLAVAMRGQQISDFPLCNKSFNLSYCGHDL